MMEKLYQLKTVPMRSDNHQAMLESVVAGLVDSWPTLPAQEGLLIYAKTQTHNTFFDRHWLDDILHRQRLGRWDVTTFGLNHCASALSALHLVRHSAVRRNKPVLLLTGRRRFTLKSTDSRSAYRRTAGGGALQCDEQPVAGDVYGGQAPEPFYNNPSNMTRQEKRN